MLYTRDLGTIPIKKRITCIFELPASINIIKNPDGTNKVIKSCGCMSYSINGNIVTIYYKPKDIPKHLEEKGYYFSSKSLTIYHKKDGRQVEDTFRLTAKIIKE